MSEGVEPTRPTSGWEGELAQHLLVRHLQVSWPLRSDPPFWMSTISETGISDRSWLSPEDEYERLTRADLRTVAVVGAGASPALPLAGALIAELERDHIGSPGERQAALERLARLYNFDPNSFEARLAAISGTPESMAATRSAIAHRFNRRQPTALTYELLAHLLKHRFLDAIISFNFDELLDQSLGDELGDSEFRRIVTERHCADTQFDPTEEDYLPLYIKMHGTASDPETLRFSQEAYYFTPRAIVDAVETVLDAEHCVLLNVGYQMANFDFQYLLRRPRRLSLFHMDPYTVGEAQERIREYRRLERPDQPEEELLVVRGCAPRSWPTAADRKAIDQEKEADSGQEPGSKPVAEALDSFLTEAFDELLEALEGECLAGDPAPRADWRSVERHRAVVELLSGSDLDNDRHYVEYLRRRTIIELAFAAAKGRGVVSIDPLIKDRPGRCFEAYCRRAKMAGLEAQSWSSLCKAGGLVRGKQSPADTYHVAKEVLQGGSTSPPPGDEVDDPWEQHRFQVIDPIRLARHVLSHLDPVRWNPESMTGDKVADWAAPEARRFHRALEGLIASTEVELYATDDRICSKVFERPRILVSLTAMKGWTRRLLTDRKYSELWVVAESGDWLRQNAEAMIKRGTLDSIKLLAAFAPEDEPETDQLAQLIEPAKAVFGFANDSTGRIELKRLFLPWYRHNRHMTILRRGGEPIAALHFARRLRTPLVTPVYLENQADLQRVEHSFKLLWDEANAYMEQTTPGGSGGLLPIELEDPLDTHLSGDVAGGTLNRGL